MGRIWRVSIALALAFAMGSSKALADDRVEPERFAASEHADLFEGEVRAVGDEALDELRGRMPAPFATQQVGVLLWDEPRRGHPPQRSGDSPPPQNVTGGVAIQVTGGATILR